MVALPPKGHSPRDRNGREVYILQPFSHFEFCVMCINYLITLVKMMLEKYFKNIVSFLKGK